MPTTPNPKSTIAEIRQPFDHDVERLVMVNQGTITTIQADFRDAQLDDDSYDVVLAAAVLHHLRDDRDWETASVQEWMWKRYGDYLLGLGGADYRDQVFAYIEKEDSPRAVTYQLDLLRNVGFESVELLHKNSCFAAFGAIKG